MSASTSRVKGVCYVTVNNYPMINIGDYTLQDGTPLFDVAIIFAANINYDTNTQKAVLGFNAQCQNILDNAATQIVPLQKKGIKVLLNVLGNHTQAGISNFADQASAKAFAQQLSDAVKKYNLDGIDFDDEWVNYGQKYNPKKHQIAIPKSNDYSFPYLVQACRELMPDKILSLYYFGPASGYLTYKKINVGTLLDYTWNATYSSWGPPSIPPMPKSNISGAAICINPHDTYTPITSQSEAEYLAHQTMNDDYGLYLYYNLPNDDMSSYLSNISQILYGQNVVYKGG